MPLKLHNHNAPLPGWDPWPVPFVPITQTTAHVNSIDIGRIQVTCFMI